MPKQVTLTSAERRTLSNAQSILSKLDITVPRSTLLSYVGTEKFVPSPEQITRFVDALNAQGKVVVTISGPSRQFTIMSIDGYLSRRKNVTRLNKARFNKKS